MLGKSVRTSLSMTARRRSITAGKPLSASPMANPHKGLAGQAMLLATMGSSSDTSLIPAARKVDSMSCFQAGLISVKMMSCES